MYAVKDSLLIEKFHLGFCRVDVHIHRVGRERQVQDAGREFAHHDLIAVGLFQRGDQKLGFHRAAVDEEGLHRPAGPGVRGLGDEAGQGILFPTAFHVHHPGTLPAIDAVSRVGQLSGAGGGEDFLAVPEHPEGNGWMGQGLHLHSGGDPGALVSVGFHEFHPGGGVEK